MPPGSFLQRDEPQGGGCQEIQFCQGPSNSRNVCRGASSLFLPQLDEVSTRAFPPPAPPPPRRPTHTRKRAHTHPLSGGWPCPRICVPRHGHMVAHGPILEKLHPRVCVGSLARLTMSCGLLFGSPESWAPFPVACLRAGHFLSI